MDGYTATSYGDGFADVYDEWYARLSDLDTTVAALVALAGNGAVLELGVGTGRLAIPLARAGLEVHGVEVSAAMRDRLMANDPERLVHVHHGDMVDDLPDGPFDLVFVAYNTLFNLTEPGRQAACFEAVARRLGPGGRFVVEAVVPPERSTETTDISLRSLTATSVVLSVAVHHPETRVAEGQFIEFTERSGIRLRPWVVRYASPEELDAMAVSAGLELERRVADAAALLTAAGSASGPVEPDVIEDRHLSVYRRADPALS